MSSRALQALFALVLVAGLLVPGTAEACAVCFDANEEPRLAFMITTVILTLLPLSLLGGTLWYLRSRWKEREAQLADESSALGGVLPIR